MTHPIPQPVTEGTTQSGAYGLFINGVLAWPFREGMYHSRLDDRPWDKLPLPEKQAFCRSLSYELVRR